MYNTKITQRALDYESDYRTDSQTQLRKETSTFKQKPGRIRPKFPPLKNSGTLTQWKKTLPFNVGWKRKEITRENPHEPQTAYFPTVDHNRVLVQKTRPRLVLTPAVALDDTEEPARQILIDDIYCSATAAMWKETTKCSSKTEARQTRAILPKMAAPARPILLPRLNPPYVSPEWRMDSASWERKAPRYCVDHTTEFWLRRSL